MTKSGENAPLMNDFKKGETVEQIFTGKGSSTREVYKQMPGDPFLDTTKQWKKEQVWPFCCCDSQADIGRHQVFKNWLFFFFPSVW